MADEHPSDIDEMPSFAGTRRRRRADPSQRVAASRRRYPRFGKVSVEGTDASDLAALKPEALDDGHGGEAIACHRDTRVAGQSDQHADSKLQ